MDSAPADIDALVDRTERLGVIGSPSSTTQLTLDILGAAVTRKLVGELALFRFLQDSASTYALGQITEVQLRNIWHEDPTMRSLIRQRGRVDAVSERQDTHLAQMTISAVFRRGAQAAYEPSILGTVPSTGTSIHLVTDDVLNQLLTAYRDQLFYAGHVYGSTPRLPFWFKHFDRGPNGTGEAYHLGIFGKTGSGKSALAKMILLAYARHPQMGLLIIDPQGEFAKDLRPQSSSADFQLPIASVLRYLGKPVRVVRVRNLVLDTWEIFAEILYESFFFERLTMPKGENRRSACHVLVDGLRKAKVTLASLSRRNSFDRAWNILNDPNVQQVFYRSSDSRQRFVGALGNANSDEFYGDYWQPVTELFRSDREGSVTVDKTISGLLEHGTASRPLVVVDLS